MSKEKLDLTLLMKDKFNKLREYKSEFNIILLDDDHNLWKVDTFNIVDDLLQVHLVNGCKYGCIDVNDNMLYQFDYKDFKKTEPLDGYEKIKIVRELTMEEKMPFPNYKLIIENIKKGR